eukprot:493450-Amphidinium_carterae.1
MSLHLLSAATWSLLESSAQFKHSTYPALAISTRTMSLKWLMGCSAPPARFKTKYPNKVLHNTGDYAEQRSLEPKTRTAKLVHSQASPMQ